MRRFPVPSLLVIALFAAAPAFASFGGGSSSNHETPGEIPEPSEQAEQKARAEAARWYGDAYDLVAKGKQELADGKTKNAEKRFRKGLEKGERAVEIDSTYHEAWNLVGYCARQVKDYDRSLAAYETCLRIKPDYAPAREYLGEAYIELGKPGPAREQLAWLEQAGVTEEAGRLKTALDAWQKAHPSEAMIPTPQAGTLEMPAPAPPVDTLAVPETK